ncbi:TIGR03571 family LLM class oxidoreductase [Xenorhabdus kozodoii]|uniref:Putative oxidoreductase n=1 Tax=Xenorhabdus kozodoii TaxID=351676 RepID=A0A2D0KXP0_9GAMM|nr:TIGR03571 family LLM class oxidoreductase [Xenorhabdus kozodoii]PHM68201.1 putative oxidoreductase [Xenorhabdus kozodoii]
MHKNITSSIDLIRSEKKITLGIELPLDNDWSPDGEQKRKIDGRPFGVPDLSCYEELVRQVDYSGFSALWMRDVLIFDQHNFGDAGSVYDPFVNLGFLAGVTQKVALGTAAVVLPLRHPLMVAKAAASVDTLSNGRLILGVATGDRPMEFPLLDVNFEHRGQLFRDSVAKMRDIWRQGKLSVDIELSSRDLDLLPHPINGDIPLIIAGQGRQTSEWIAQNMEGRFVYPNSFSTLAEQSASWRQLRMELHCPPGIFISAFHLDLANDAELLPEPHRFGARIGRKALIKYLKECHLVGIDHMVLHLRRSRRPIGDVLNELSQEVLPYI